MDKLSIQYSTVIKEMYRHFVLNNQEYNSFKIKLIIDFEDYQFLKDGTGYANIWVQPLTPSLYHSRTGPINEIEISGLVFTIQLLSENEKMALVIDSSFNPSDWNGRNKLSYNDIGKTVITGTNRLYKAELNSDSSSVIYIRKNFNRLLIEAFAHYFI